MISSKKILDLKRWVDLKTFQRKILAKQLQQWYMDIAKAKNVVFEWLKKFYISRNIK